MVRREVNSPATIKYTLSNADEQTSVNKLAQMQAQRFWIERAFQDAKSHVGMADYQARMWPPWHHHMALVMMAMQFMLDQRNQVELIDIAFITSAPCYWLVMPVSPIVRPSAGSPPSVAAAGVLSHCLLLLSAQHDIAQQ
jgi:hypothetical protein